MVVYSAWSLLRPPYKNRGWRNRVHDQELCGRSSPLFLRVQYRIEKTLMKWMNLHYTRSSWERARYEEGEAKIDLDLLLERDPLKVSRWRRQRWRWRVRWRGRWWVFYEIRTLPCQTAIARCQLFGLECSRLPRSPLGIRSGRQCNN